MDGLLLRALLFVHISVALIESQISAPSTPNITSITPSTTSISLTWTQSPEDTVESYIIKYSYTVIGCSEVPENTGNISVSGNNGSTRMYTITELEENSNYTVSIAAVNEAGPSAMSSEEITRTLVAAPSVAPALRVSSTTPTTISIAWDEVPCLDRNGQIRRYVVSYCLASDSSCAQHVISALDLTNRTITITGLIPREKYNIKINADNKNENLSIYTGPFSTPIAAETDTPQDVGFFLKGTLYSGNVAVALTDIGAGSDALMCLTTLVECCRGSDTNDKGALGTLLFPNRSIVPSRNTGANISRTRALSSILLHRSNNIISPTGIYTCAVPDANNNTRSLYIYLYAGQLPALSTALEYSHDSSQLTCTSCGGLVESVTWTINGTIVTSDDALISQTLTLVDRVTATSRVVLSANISYFVGTFGCEVTDGNGRTSSAAILINGVTVRSSPMVPLRVGENASLICSNDAGVADLIEWTTGDGTVLISATSVEMLELFLTPVNDSLSVHGAVFTCHVTRNNESYLQNLTVTVTVPSPLIAMSIDTSGSLVAGSEFNLTCVVSKLFTGLTGSPMATWTAESIFGTELTSSATDMAMAVLNINPLRNSYPMLYICSGSYFSPAENRTHVVEERRDIRVQIPTPEVSVSVSSGPLVAGGVDDVTLTCSATVDSFIVDFGILGYAFTWLDRRGTTILTVNRTTIVSSTNNNISTLALSPLSIEDTNFTCTVVVHDIMNRLGSSAAGAMSTTLNIQVMEPTLSGNIIGYPINSNFFTGLQLNLTCFITISYTIYNEIEDVEVLAEWTRSGSAIDSNSGRTVVEVFKVGKMQYQTSILFNALDKSTDEGKYTCTVKAIFKQRRNGTLIKNIESSHIMEVDSIFFQLQLTGISNCENWKANNPLSKDMDIENAIIKFMKTNCGCDFTADRLTDRVFICDSNSPQSVIYQAQLHGTLQANVSGLVASFHKWISSDARFIPVQLSLLEIERFCIVSSNSQSLCGITTPSTYVLSIDYLGAIIGGALFIIVFIIITFIMTIAICVMQRRRKLNLKLDKELKNTNIIPLGYLTTTDSHFYEDIEKYHISCPNQCSADHDIGTTTFSDDHDIGISACPAYISLPPTDNQPDIHVEAEYDTIPQ